MNIRGGV